MKLLAIVVPALLALATTAHADALDLVFSGGQRGISRASSRFELQDRLKPELAAAGIEVERVDVLHGVMAQGEYEVWPVDGSVESALTYAAGSPTCDEGELVETARTPTERFVPRPGAPAIRVRDALVEPRWMQRCRAGGVFAVALSPPVAPGAELLTLDAFHLRTGFRWVAGEHQWFQLGHPRREPARRLGAIQAAMAERPGALFVDAGDFLDPDGRSGDSEWIAARAAAYEVLRALEPAALAAGRAELSEGIVTFAAEAEGMPYIGTNWTHAGGPAPFPRHRVVEVAARRIAFLGITDPDLVDLELLAGEGLTLEDPVEAVNAEVDRLVTASSPPDLIVLLGHALPDLQRRLRSSLRGVDLFLGDPSLATFRVKRGHTVFDRVGAAFKAAPITLPLDGIAAARVLFGDAGPTDLHWRPLEVPADGPSNDDLARVTTDLTARRLRGHEGALIAAEHPLDGVSRARWEKVVCESVAESVDADAVFIDGLPWSLPTPGPLTEPLVVDRLRGGHVLEVHKVDGDRFKGFLKAVQGQVAIACGAPEKPGLVRGRYIDPQQTYRVVTTDRTRENRTFANHLHDASSGLIGDLPRYAPVRDDAGALTLDRAVIRALTSGVALDALEARSVADVSRQWLLRLNRISLRLVRFEGARTDAYTAVPETALASPSSFTVGIDTDVALEFASRAVRADLRVEASYTRFAVDGIPAQETADDFVVSTTWDLPFASFPPKGAFQFQPFLQLGLDSEFTPFEAEDGTRAPRQADLTFFAGVAARPSSWLRALRLGPFINRDLARLDDKGLEYGVRWTGATLHQPLPLGALRILTAWDLQVFGDTAFDDASDLRLRLWGEVRVQVRIVRSLNLALFAEGLLVQGRVDATRTPAATATLGVALDVGASLRLDARPVVFGPAARKKVSARR